MQRPHSELWMLIFVQAVLCFSSMMFSLWYQPFYRHFPYTHVANSGSDPDRNTTWTLFLHRAFACILGIWMLDPSSFIHAYNNLYVLCLSCHCLHSSDGSQFTASRYLLYLLRLCNISPLNPPVQLWIKRRTQTTAKFRNHEVSPPGHQLQIQKCIVGIELWAFGNLKITHLIPSWSCDAVEI